VKRKDRDTLVKNSSVVVCTCSNVIQNISFGHINDSNVHVSRSDKTEYT
jgi:hypothetical protein